MAELFWGKVYFKDVFAGYLRQEPGETVSFAYDASYLQSNLPPIAHTLPLQEAAFKSHNGLHPFFDNLVAEGWLEGAQKRLLGKRSLSRFELLLAFGADCAGAVSVVDPEIEKRTQSLLDVHDPKEMALLTSRASLSGVQPKITLIEEKGKLRPVRANELSTHIAKFASRGHPDLLDNEILTTKAFKSLLPSDGVVELYMGEIEGFKEPALIIKRFDRYQGARLHFEEFNQLLGKQSAAKYDGSHQEMAEFILTSDKCLPVQAYHLYARVLAGLLLGNTDMHFKNFAMFHTETGYRLTPSYDQVCAALYDYKTLALSIRGASNLRIGNLKPKHILELGKEFVLSSQAIQMIVEQLGKNLDAAKQSIAESPVGSITMRDQLIDQMEKRWNGIFALIGKSLSAKQ